MTRPRGGAADLSACGSICETLMATFFPPAVANQALLERHFT
jgi:hypothetical protein